MTARDLPDILTFKRLRGWTWDEKAGLTWFPKEAGRGTPTASEIVAWRAEWLASLPVEKARQDRALAYPPVGDQLDAIWGVLRSLGRTLPDDARAILDKIDAVKAANPKP